MVRVCPFSSLLFFKCQKFVVVVRPTISLVNLQIEGLKKFNIDATASGNAAEDAQLNNDRKNQSKCQNTGLGRDAQNV